MPFPTPIVEIAFNDSPYVASPTWTDVTSYVRSATTDRGRSDDWSAFEGYASVVLDNRTRLFDPFNSAGAYYGKLTPRRQIRIRATYSGTTYDVFRGYIAAWPPVWTDAGYDSTVTLSCFDALGLLASETLPADWAHPYILSTSPRHYYPCNEPVAPFMAGGILKDYGSVPLNMATTAVASNGDQLAAGLVNSSITGTGSESALSAIGNVDPNPSSFSVSCWAIPDTSSAGSSQFLQGFIGNQTFYFGYSNTTAKFFVEVTEPTYGNSKIASTTLSGWDTGMPRLFSFTYNSATRVISLYIDGLAIATGVTNSAGIYIGLNEAVNIGTGSVQQVIVWDGVQSQTVFQNIFKYSTVAFSESTAARFQRLISETSFPASLTSPPSAPVSTVLDITDDAPRVTSELQKVADSEYAPLFTTKAGVVTLYNQGQIFSQTASTVSQGTYGACGIGIGQEIELSYDGDSIRNQASITMSQGGVYEVANSTSVDTYGASEASLDTQVASLANAVSVGSIVTGWGGNIYPKASQFEVVLSPYGDWANALSRELNDRITLAVQPPTGSVISYPMLLNRISHSIVPGQWRTSFEGSARWAAVFIINQSLIGGTDLLG